MKLTMRWRQNKLIWNLLPWAVVFFLTRVLLATLLPIFNDESSYLYWGRIIFSDYGGWDFTMKLDQRPPGIPLLYAPWLILPLDPLFIGRVIAAFYSTIGFLIVIGLARVLNEKQNWKFIALVLLFTPLTFFYERMILAEPFLMIIYSLLFLITLTADKRSWGKWILIGLLLGIGYWIKATVLLMVLPLVVTKIIVDRQGERRTRETVKDLLIAGVTFLGVVLPIVTHPEMKTTNDRWIMSVPELLAFPWQLWIENARRVTEWSLLLAPAIVLVVGGFLRSDKNRKWPMIWFGIPVVLLVLVTRDLTTRYIVWLFPVILIAAGWGLEVVFRKNRLAGVGLAAVFAIQTVWLAAFPLEFYKTMAFSARVKNDLSQYFTGFSSGYGVKEAASFLRKQSESKPGVVLVRNDTGNPEGGMFVYLDKEPRLKVYYLNILPALIGNEAFRKSGLAVYFVSRGSQYAGFEPALGELARYAKPLDAEYVGVYQLDINRIVVK